MNRLLALVFLMLGGVLHLSASIEIDIDNCICRVGEKEHLIVGYGTYPLTGDVCTAAVEKAIEVGYRMIDTATYYQNFDSIARALKSKDRRCFYLVSKVWYDKQLPEDLCKDLEATLEKLQTDYLDAYLLHWPNSKISIEKTLATMNELMRAKKVRHIGLSNISINHLKRALEVGVPITWVQIEMHPHFCDFELVEFCHDQSIAVQAWAPLGRGRISYDPTLTAIGQKYKKSASQVAIRWIIQHGCIPLPGSKNEQHMRENADIKDFALTEDEMTAIDDGARVGERERFTKATIGFDDELDFSYEQCWPND